MISAISFFRDVKVPDVRERMVNETAKRWAKILRVLNFLLGVLAAILLIYYIYSVGAVYQNMHTAPPTRVTFRSVTGETFPMITFCPFPGGAINFELCTQYKGENEATNPSLPCTPTYINMTRDFGAGPNQVTCWQLNNNPSNLLSASGSGFFNGVDVVMRYTQTDPANAINAVFVTYSDAGVAIDETAVLPQAVFVAPSQTTLVQLLRIDSIDLTGAVTQRTWNPTITTIPTSAGLDPHPETLVYVSTSYRNRGVQEVRDVDVYPLSSLFGDLSGMGLFLTGLHFAVILLAGERLLYRLCNRQSTRTRRNSDPGLPHKGSDYPEGGSGKVHMPLERLASALDVDTPTRAAWDRSSTTDAAVQQRRTQPLSIDVLGPAGEASPVSDTTNTSVPPSPNDPVTEHDNEMYQSMRSSGGLSSMRTPRTRFQLESASSVDDVVIRVKDHDPFDVLFQPQ